MKYIKKFSTIATATGLGALLATGMTGCGDNNQPQQEQAQAKGATVVIGEIEPGKYKILDESPADETTIILKKLDGTKQILTKAEMDALVKEEAAKVDNGTSELTKANPAASGGMGLGGTIMASMAGAMLGSYIGNKLFGNQNYQNNRKASYKSPSTYSKSKKSFSQPRKSTSSKRSGFFGGNKKSSSSRSSGRSSYGG
ncbi:MAG: UPF0323 family lipoprotein [Sulfurovum sp.]|nr:UPF0323 family lipoprotein [Sulfurovum sp.]